MYKCVTCPSNVWAETGYTGLKWIKEHDDLCFNIVKAGNQRSPIQVLTSSNLHTFPDGLPEKYFFSWKVTAISVLSPHCHQSLSHSSSTIELDSSCSYWRRPCWPWARKFVCVVIQMALKYNIYPLRTTLYYLWNHIISITKLSKILLLSPPVITEVLTHHSRTTAYGVAALLKSARSLSFLIISVWPFFFFFWQLNNPLLKGYN